MPPGSEHSKHRGSSEQGERELSFAAATTQFYFIEAWSRYSESVPD